VRVLVNAVAARLGGGAQHLAPFLVELTRHLPDAELNVFVTSEFDDRVQQLGLRWNTVHVPPGINFRRIFWDNITVPRLARDHDAILSPLNFGPLYAPVPHVLFQRNPVYFDRTNRRLQSAPARSKLAGYRWLAILGSNTADCVVVPSEAMASMIRGYLKNDRKVVVAKHGFDAQRAQRLSSGDLPPGADGWCKLDLKLLHVGHPGTHKNLKVLAQTLAQIVAEDPARSVGLAVTFDAYDHSEAGQIFQAEAATAGVLERVHFLGNTPHTKIYPLYEAADVLLLPSITESFGFPILEAFAMGTPVVASRHPAIEEISGGLAFLHDHSDSRGAARLALEAFRGGRTEASRRKQWATSFPPHAQAMAVAAELHRLTGDTAR
jgi:glycosyltransferase involved in cell wall biosynthesis